MADTLTRIAGPQTSSRADAGTTIYTPKSREIVALKNAVLVNTDPAKGAWAYLSIGAMTTKSNWIVPGIYVPPSTTITAPLDIILNGGTETIVARQTVDMTYSQLVPTIGPAAISSTTNATTYATASWAATNGVPYLMFVTATHATAAAAPTSFTDTHSGITWTQVGSTITNSAGVAAGAPTMAMSVWRSQSTGTTNTTTTANFGATMTGCHIVIMKIAGGDVTGTHGSECIIDGGTFLGSQTTQTAVSLIGSKICGARVAALTSQPGAAAGASTPGVGFTEVSDAAYITPDNMMTTEYSISPGTTADFTLDTTSTDKMGALVGLQDGSTPVNFVLNGVVIT